MPRPSPAGERVLDFLCCVVCSAGFCVVVHVCECDGAHRAQVSFEGCVVLSLQHAQWVGQVQGMARKTQARQRRLAAEMQRLAAAGEAASYAYAEAISCR
jgi:hypothetical protein